MAIHIGSSNNIGTGTINGSAHKIAPPIISGPNNSGGATIIVATNISRANSNGTANNIASPNVIGAANVIGPIGVNGPKAQRGFTPSHREAMLD